MAITVYWYDETRRILYYSFKDRWTWEEYFIALARGRSLMKSAGQLVCTINDLQQTDYLPDDFIEKAGDVSRTRPLNSGVSVYISQSPFFAAIYQVLCGLYPETPIRYPLVTTEEEALQKIAAWFALHDE